MQCNTKINKWVQQLIDTPRNYNKPVLFQKYKYFPSYVFLLLAEKLKEPEEITKLKESECDTFE
jgi:hypothetical protein